MTLRSHFLLHFKTMWELKTRPLRWDGENWYYFLAMLSQERNGLHKSFEGRKAASTPSAISSTLWCRIWQEGRFRSEESWYATFAGLWAKCDWLLSLRIFLIRIPRFLPHSSALTRSEILELGIEIPSFPLHFFRKGSVSFQTSKIPTSRWNRGLKVVSPGLFCKNKNQQKLRFHENAKCRVPLKVYQSFTFRAPYEVQNRNSCFVSWIGTYRQPKMVAWNGYKTDSIHRQTGLRRFPAVFASDREMQQVCVGKCIDCT